MTQLQVAPPARAIAFHRALPAGSDLRLCRDATPPGRERSCETPERCSPKETGPESYPDPNETPAPAQPATRALHAAAGQASTASTLFPVPFLPRRDGGPAGTPSRGSRRCSRPPPSFAQPWGYVRLTVSFPGKARRKT